MEIEEETINLSFQHPYLFPKRIIDVVFSSVLVIITIPIVITFALLIKIESKGPAFYKQERVGIYGSKIIIIKLRSMFIDAEKNGAKWAEKNDNRVTRIGKIIRKTRIDELPQLYSVIKGDMSLIGPRPERPIFTKKFTKEIKGFEQRLRVKPGLSGLAQVNGGYILGPKEKLELDLLYIENFGLKLDLKILLHTIRVVFTGEGAL